MTTKKDPDFTAEAHALGYHPFIRFSPLEYLTFCELFGENCFKEMFMRLKDPERLYPAWAAGFMGAASLLPADEVSAAADLHAFVTESELFKRRRKYKQIFEAKFYKVYTRLKAGGLDIAEPARSILLADFARWRDELKARSAALLEQKKLEAEKKAHSEATKAMEAKAPPNKTEDVVKAAEKKPEPEKAPVKSSGPVIERKISSPVSQKSAIPNSNGVWRNPHSTADSTHPRPYRQEVTIVRKTAK